MVDLGLLVLAGLVSVGVLSYILVLLLTQLKIVNRLTETNKQLLIIVAGKEPKPESALRALIASDNPPRGKLPGIAEKKKKDDKPKNIDYVMELGV